MTGSGLVHRPPTGTPDHQQALSPASTAGRPRMRPSRLPRGTPRPEGSHVDRLDGGGRRVAHLAGYPAERPRGPGWGTGAGVSGATDLVAPVALEGTPARPWPEAPWQPRRPPPAGTTSPERAGEGELVRFPPPAPPWSRTSLWLANGHARPAAVRLPTDGWPGVAVHPSPPKRSG